MLGGGARYITYRWQIPITHEATTGQRDLPPGLNPVHLSHPVGVVLGGAELSRSKS